MLYDQKWEKPSLASLIGWLETQNPRKRYDFNNCKGECLLGQYMTAIGIEWGQTPATVCGLWTSTSYYTTADKIFGKGRVLSVLHKRPWTFGAALGRAREFAA